MLILSSQLIIFVWGENVIEKMQKWTFQFLTQHHLTDEKNFTVLPVLLVPALLGMSYASGLAARAGV